MTLEQARERSRELRLMAREVVSGVRARTEVVSSVRPRIVHVTFADAARQYHKEIKGPQLKEGRFRDRWLESLEDHVHPILGSRPLASIMPVEIIELLRPLWHGKRETAQRLLQRMGLVFRWSIATGLRSTQGNRVKIISG